MSTNGVRNPVREILGRAEEVKEPPGEEPRAPEFSDEALALGFAAKHRDDLRYVAAWGRWLSWRGDHWREDRTLSAFDRVRMVCRAAADGCRTSATAKALASAKTVGAVHTLARSDRRLAATVDQWDNDPWLLNTPTGIVDLRTGRSQAHRRDDYCTKITAVAPGGGCPVWLKFLDRVTGGDKELQLFLQRMAGYALTGLTREHAMFFLYGTGANGKSVFLNTISHILDGYATSAPIETFIASNAERHPTDLAGLRGARLVTAIETEEGRRWAEAKLKVLTGGDPVSARFMRQDYFEFTPQFKLVVAGNHRPGLRSVDEAIRRRLHLIPFTVTIPEDERDDELPEKLKAEWGGILAWMIEGALEWSLTGLDVPNAVRAATEEYFATEDALAQWMSECCRVDPQGYATAAILFASWKAWAELAGEPSGNMKRFSQALAARGFQPRRQGGTGRNGFEGIDLGGTGDFGDV